MTEVIRHKDPFAVDRDQLLADPDFREEYEEHRSYVDVIRQLIDARREKGWTQKELAKVTGIKRSNISRIESGNGNITLETLIKLTRALGVHVTI